MIKQKTVQKKLIFQCTVFLTRLNETLLRASCTQLDNVDMQVYVSDSTWEEARLRQILHKAHLLSHFTTQKCGCLHTFNKKLTSFPTGYNWTNQICSQWHDRKVTLNTYIIQLDTIILLLRKKDYTVPGKIISYLFCGL